MRARVFVADAAVLIEVHCGGGETFERDWLRRWVEECAGLTVHADDHAEVGVGYVAARVHTRRARPLLELCHELDARCPRSIPGYAPLSPATRPSGQPAIVSVMSAW